MEAGEYFARDHTTEKKSRRSSQLLKKFVGVTI
uniref:Uncharacterized protein n=1 Tax=Romanomermis culicivorax TaxID=13658 RepID=A0A915HJ93_ROMCU